MSSALHTLSFGLLGGKAAKLPKPKPAIQPPNEQQLRQDAEISAAERRGRLAGYVTGPQGSGLPSSGGKKSLLGS